jgi:3-hydroxyisobutyrate dehydrogenase-like beta-hydroxyacid dehydrogenase
VGDVSVLGLGSMGSALARTLGNAGKSVVVWNRSRERTAPFVQQGMTVADDVAQAVAASPAVVICVDSNMVADQFLQTEPVAHVLKDRVIIQFSTSTPREAEASATWLQAQGAHYLDGAIHCGPGHIGTDDAAFLISGDVTAYESVTPLLSDLGGTITYLGSGVRAASALDLASVCEVYGRFVAVSHAALMCEAEGVSLDDLAALMPDGGFSRRYVDVIRDGAFENPAATLRIWNSAIQRVRSQGHDAGIDTKFPDYVGDLFSGAIDEGLGDEHVMALIKVLRKT